MVESSSKLLKLEKLVGGADNYQEWRMRTQQKLKGLNKLRFVIGLSRGARLHRRQVG